MGHEFLKKLNFFVGNIGDKNKLHEDKNITNYFSSKNIYYFEII